MIKNIFDKVSSSIMDKAVFMSPMLLVFSAQASVLVSSKVSNASVGSIVVMVAIRAIIIPQVKKLQIIKKVRELDFKAIISKLPRYMANARLAKRMQLSLVHA